MESLNGTPHLDFCDIEPQGYAVSYNLNAYGKNTLSDIHTLPELLESYGNILWETGKHKYNVTAFIMELHELMPKKGFSVFRQNMLDDLVNALRARGNSNATINRKMAALGKLLRKAQKMGVISSLPEFTRQKERAGRIRFLELEEEQRLFEAIGARSELYHRFCIFLVDTGARLSEAITLRWTDLQGPVASFWVTKSGRSRSVPLTTRALAAVAGSEGRAKGPFQEVDQQRFRAAWNAAKLEIGLGHDDDVVPHVLRHTCASRLVRGGIDIRRVQTWLGHQTMQMTMRYAHLAPHDLDICLPVLERSAR